MPPEIITGIFTSAGAIIGVLSTTLATALSSRSKRREARYARDEKVNEIRRQDYAALLTCAAAFMNTARSLHESLVHRSELAVVDAAQKQYDLDWANLVQSTVSVELVGPQMIGQEALALRRVIGKYSASIDSRVLTYRTNMNPPGSISELEPEYAAYRSRRQEFIRQAQVALDLLL